MSQKRRCSRLGKGILDKLVEEAVEEARSAERITFVCGGDSCSLALEVSSKEPLSLTQHDFIMQEIRKISNVLNPS